MAYGFNNDKSKFTIPGSSGTSGKFVVFTDNITAVQDQYIVQSYNASEFQSIFGTNDSSKVHIISLDMKINIGTTSEPKYSWTTQPGSVASKWYSFPRYDVYDPALSDRQLDITVYNPIQLTASENVPIRLVAFVED